MTDTLGSFVYGLLIFSVVVRKHAMAVHTSMSVTVVCIDKVHQLPWCIMVTLIHVDS